MRIDENYFVDSNILICAVSESDPRREACQKILQIPDGMRIHLSPQILVEFYSVITNPKRVVDPLTSEQAVSFLESLLGDSEITLLPISTDVPRKWLSLIKAQYRTGPRVFDLQIAATMLAHGLSKIITYNTGDFQTIPGIEALTPEAA